LVRQKIGNFLGTWSYFKKRIMAGELQKKEISSFEPKRNYSGKRQAINVQICFFSDKGGFSNAKIYNVENVSNLE